MLNSERREAIVKIVTENGAASVTELTKMLDSSESTIRRDILFLSKAGRIQRTHGGATMSSRQFISVEETFAAKSAKNAEAKRRIAKYAAEQINDSDFVFVDAGTTTLYMIEYINDGCEATFVTNGIAQAEYLSRRGFKVIIIGGQLKAATGAIIGMEAAANVQIYNFTKAFIGVNGISKSQGYSTPDPEEAFIKKTAIDRSFVSYVLADSDKFGKVSQVTFSSIDKACIVTDKEPDKDYYNWTVIKVV
ncbi:MAG: DeoR/GlpR family DNA-binding transcription regulator [Oscillospiraceae bacterium]|nr:DeoR/GlpR family DNA-binding transcription regulator [Oscillospiraceae bacterium]